MSSLVCPGRKLDPWPPPPPPFKASSPQPRSRRRRKHATATATSPCARCASTAAAPRRRARRIDLQDAHADLGIRAAGAERGRAGHRADPRVAPLRRPLPLRGGALPRQPAPRIVANDMRRDGRNVGANDNFSVIFDTFHDRRNGYEFLITRSAARGHQVTDERDINRDWNTPWIPRSRRDNEGWTLEMAIPFRSLRYRGRGRAGLGRQHPPQRALEERALVPQPGAAALGPRGILRLSHGGHPGRARAAAAALNLDVKPYAVGTVTADRAVDPLRHRARRRRRLRPEVRVHPGLTADLTYRTDFAQVEDDDQQVNLTRFSVFSRRSASSSSRARASLPSAARRARRPGNPPWRASDERRSCSSAGRSGWAAAAPFPSGAAGG